MNTHWRKFARTQSIGTLSTTLDVIRHTIDHSITADNDNANGEDANCDANGDDANNDDANIFSENNEFNITSLTIKINESEVPFSVSNPPYNNCIHILENYNNNSNYEARFGVFKNSNTNNGKNYFLTIFDSNRNILFDSITTIQLNGSSTQKLTIDGYQVSPTPINTQDGEEYIVYKTASSTLTITIS